MRQGEIGQKVKGKTRSAGYNNKLTTEKDYNDAPQSAKVTAQATCFRGGSEMKRMLNVA